MLGPLRFHKGESLYAHDGSLRDMIPCRDTSFVQNIAFLSLFTSAL